MAYDLDRIQINIQADTSQAVKAYQQLSRTLTRLKKVTQSDFGLGKLAVETNRFARAIRSSLPVIERYARALETISQSRLRRVSADAVARAEKQAANETARAVDGSVGVDSKKVKGANKELEKTDKTLDRVDKRAKKASKSFKLFNGQIGKILMYRAIRGAISAVANAMKEGSDNYYAYLSMTQQYSSNAGMKKSLDDISSTLLALKNTMGVTLMSLAITFKPLIEGLSNSLTTIGNGLTAIMHKANKSIPYIEANRDAIKEWSDTAKNAVQGFDELNVLAGTQGTSFDSMFNNFEDDPAAMEEAADNAIKAFGEEAKKILEVIAAYEGLKILVKAITGLFRDKNTALGKQTELTKGDAKVTEGLGDKIGYAAGALLGSAGLIGGLGLLGDALDGLPFGKAQEGLAGLETGIANATTTWGDSLDEIVADTQSAVTEINQALSELGNTPAKSPAVPLPISNEAYLKSLGVSPLEVNTSKSTSAKVVASTSASIVPISNAAYLEAMGAKKLDLDSKVSSIGTQKAASTPTGNALKSLIEGNPMLSNVALSALPSNAQNALMAANELGAFNYGGDSNDAVKNLWDKVIESNTAIYQDLPEAFAEAVEKLKKVLRFAPAAGSPFPIAGFASGGFVSAGQVFVAREAGPEMVGTIGGKTAVANNDQITEAISSAVYEAMMAAGGGSVNVTLEGDANKLFRVVQNEARKYNRSTGSYAF